MPALQQPQDQAAHVHLRACCGGRLIITQKQRRQLRRKLQRLHRLRAQPLAQYIPSVNE